ncbi:MAG: hypothetical protein Q8L00_05145, partial [Deltaproteobacteria bacterium]|nr:hypothetical protein [Deltaproteobacteria bacterium]
MLANKDPGDFAIRAYPDPGLEQPTTPKDQAPQRANTARPASRYTPAGLRLADRGNPGPVPGRRP